MPRTKASSKNYKVSIRNEMVRVEKNKQLSVPEYKIIKLGISRIQQNHDFLNNDWEKLRFVQYSIDEFCQIFDVKKRGYLKVLKTHIANLQSFGLRIYADDETQFLTVFPWISLNTKTQKVELEFNHRLKPMFCDFSDGGFFKIGYAEIFGMSSSYAISMYDFLKSYMNKRDKTCIYDYVDLRKLFGIEDKEYSRFFNFKNKVIDVAQQQISANENALFDFEYELIADPSHRRGKPKITAIKFTIIPREFMPDPISELPDTIGRVKNYIIGKPCPKCNKGKIKIKSPKDKPDGLFLGCTAWRKTEGCSWIVNLTRKEQENLKPFVEKYNEQLKVF